MSIGIKREIPGNWVKILVVMFGVLTAILMTGCKAKQIQSIWKQDPVTIDGQRDDWQDKAIYLESEQALIGVQNDENYLYLMFTSGIRSTQFQVMRQGLFVWFSSGKDESRRFGIHFPLARKARRSAAENETAEKGAEKPDHEGKSVLESTKMEIFQPGESHGKTMDLAGLPGIEAKISRGYGEMVYELKVPLKKDDSHPFAISAAPGQALHLEFVVPSVEEKPQRNRRPAGVGGFGGRPDGFGGGEAYAEAPVPGGNAALKLKFDVQLATPATTNAKR